MPTSGTPTVAPTLTPVRAMAALAAMTLVSGVVIFVAAGTVAWPAAWVYLAVISVLLGVYSAIMVRLHPDLIEERRHPPADAKRWDKPFVAILGGAGPLVLLIVCALDRRFGWSGPAASGLPVLGLLVVAAAGSLSAWAVATNRFFSAVVRIQRDRGHHVVDSGPYRFVRHPGYAGSILHLIGTSLALGSWPGMGLALVQAVLFVVRTSLEDATLQAELEGYAEYASRVPFRLVPGVW